MNNTVATSLAKGNAAEATQRLVQDLRAKLQGATPVLVTAFASTQQPLEAVMRGLAKEYPGAALLGASTAGEFVEDRDDKSSVAVFALAGDFRVFAGIGTGLKANPEAAVKQALDGLPGEVRGYSYRTGLLLLDPLAGNGEETTLTAAALIGEEIPWAGGAAGDDLQMKVTHVGAGTKVASDAVAVGMIFSKAPLGLGVCHGHQPLSAPLRVTKAEGNVVSEIEGRPAWDVWKEHTRENAKTHGIDVATLPADQEGGFFLRYEAGLATGSEYKIRAPLSRTGTSINFACGIAQGSVIRITESVADRQIASAREAARRARARLGSRAPAGALVFDCICRNLILGADFSRAVRGMSEELAGAPLAGFETYGEIALDAGDMSGFHNTTSVVLAFPGDT